MKRIFALAALLLALSVVPALASASCGLTGTLCAQVETILSGHLDGNGCANGVAYVQIRQTAAGKRGGPVTPDDSAWLYQLAQNIADEQVSNPPTYPAVVYGAYCV